jgi:hypothetical protein
MTYYPSGGQVSPTTSSLPLLVKSTTESAASSPPWSGDSAFVHNPRSAIVSPPFGDGSWARSLPSVKKLFRSKKTSDDTETEKLQHQPTTSDAEVSPTRQSLDEKTPWYQTSQRWLL